MAESTKRTGGKAAAILMAMLFLERGVKTVAADPVLGGVEIGIAVFLVVVYVAAERVDHEQPYNEIVEAIGEDTLTRLSYATAEEIEKLIDQVRDEENQ